MKTVRTANSRKRPRRVTASMPKLTRREVEFVKALYAELTEPGRFSRRILEAAEKLKEG